MANKLYKFTFKKQNTGPWDMTKCIDIKYKGVIVGLLSSHGYEKWIIRLQIPASEKAIATNPNCKWMWASVKQRFDTSEDAKKWLNENRETLVPQLYYQDNGQS